MLQRIRNIKVILVAVAIIIAITSLLTSHLLTRDLQIEETKSVEVWAEAMRSLNNADENTDLNLVLKVINGNNTIPVIVMDQNGMVQTHRNINKTFQLETYYLYYSIKNAPAEHIIGLGLNIYL